MKKVNVEKTFLRVLYLEDSLLDIELIKELIIEAGYELTLDYTDNETEFISLLKINSYDIVLSDFSLPGFNAFGALELTRKFSPDTPFICISGSIGEETAIELIKKGAVDYILKDRTARLPFAIVRALEAAKETNLRRQAELDLQKSNLKFQTLAVSSPVGIFQTDIDGSTTYVNPKWCQMAGLSADQALGDGWINAVHPDDRDMLIKGWKNATKQHGASYSDYRFLRPDGTIAWVMGQAIPETNSDNQIVGYLGTITDITERKQTEEALLASEIKYRAFFENSMDAILLTSPDGKILSANPAACLMLGYSEDELILLGRKGIVDTTDPNLEALLLERKLKGNAHGELRMIKKDGTYFPVEISSAIFKSEEGFEHSSMIIRDISERKLTEEALRQSEQRYKLLLESITDYTYSVEIKNGRADKTVHSSGCENVTGYTPADYLTIPKLWLQMVHPDDQKLVEHYADPLCEGKEVPPLEHRIIHKSGYTIWVRNTYVLKHDANGKVIGYDGLISDITKRKLAEVALQRSEEQYRMLFDQMTSGFALHEIILNDNKQPIDYKYIQVNKAFEQLTGLHAEAIIGKTVLEILPNTESFFIERYGKVALDGEAIHFESYSQGLNKTYSIHAYAPEYGKFATIFEDITERKLAEEKLNLLAAIVESTDDAIFTKNMDGIITSWNAGAQNMYGYTEAEMIGKSVSLIFPKGYENEMISILNKIKSGEHIKHFETTRCTKNGKEIIVSLTISPIKDNKGKIIAASTIERDITKSKHMENEVRDSEERFRMVFENVFDGIALYTEDPDPSKRKLIDCNERYAVMAGRSRDELLGLENTLSLQKTLDFEANDNRLKSLDVGKEYSGYFSWIRPDGKENIIEYVGVPVTLRGNFYSIGIDRDVTERKRAEIELRKLSTAVEQSSASVVITDTNGNIEYINPRVTKVTGYTVDEAIGKNPRIWNSGETPIATYKRMWDTIISGKEWQGEFRNKKKNGEFFWESASISPIKDEHGKIKHFLAVKEDITEKKRIVFELIEAKDKAEEMNRMKSNFMANMSHELRTPLVGLLGLSEIMKDELEGENKENAKMIYDSSFRLLSTITGILNFSKIESEKLTFELSVVDLTQIILDEIKLFRSPAEQKGLSIIEYFSTDVMPIETDEKMLREIIDNLLSNAVKFTSSGNITISTEQIESEVIIKISDTGIGIPKEKIDTIFEAFRQVSEGLSRNFEGTGLGLTIVKNYVNLLNGSIELESEINIGSTFIIHLPSFQTQQSKPSKEKKNDLIENVRTTSKRNFLKVLLVEDDYISSMTMQRMLDKEYEVITVQNGQKAIEVVKNQEIDIILMDINLQSGLNGIETTQIIRKIPRYKNKPIVAVTAYAMPNDEAEFLQAGCSHYLAKPFTRNVLMRLLEKITTEYKFR